ncbi:hypothetical protein RRG08_050913 [Elysia crispata]|uniref:BHLH domain-containing protein n=1 Tax=Elysia crispata TaxID=231223 RepID=A0AAE0ZSI6_9GAST|nr:hypothetical protein RRG08_050913 [Elysia crispata]
MVTMATYKQQGISVAQVVARRQVRMHLRKIREREYAKLRSLIPAVAAKKKTTKVQVVEEAVRYIEELHLALLARFREKHGSLAEDKAQETVQTFVNRMMGHTSPAPSSSPAHREGGATVRHTPKRVGPTRSHPSFLLVEITSNLTVIYCESSFPWLPTALPSYKIRETSMRAMNFQTSGASACMAPMLLPMCQHCSPVSVSALFTPVSDSTVHPCQCQHCLPVSVSALFTRVSVSTVHPCQCQHCSPVSVSALFTRVSASTVHPCQCQHCSPVSVSALFTPVSASTVHPCQCQHCSPVSVSALFTRVSVSTVHPCQCQHCSPVSVSALFTGVSVSTVHRCQCQHCSPVSVTALFTPVSVTTVHPCQCQHCSLVSVSALFTPISTVHRCQWQHYSPLSRFVSLLNAQSKLGSEFCARQFSPRHLILGFFKESIVIHESNQIQVGTAACM